MRQHVGCMLLHWSPRRRASRQNEWMKTRWHARCTLPHQQKKERKQDSMWVAHCLVIPLHLLAALLHILPCSQLLPSLYPYHPTHCLTWWCGVVGAIGNWWCGIAGGHHWGHWGPVMWHWLGGVKQVSGGVGRGDVALFAAFLTALGAGDVASVGSVVGGVWGLWCGVIGCQQDRQAHPGLAQEWAVTRGLNSGSGGCT